MIFWPKESLSVAQPTLRYLYWLGAFFSGLIAILAGQVVMGLIFAELALFLMHAYHLLDGGIDGQSARVSYFRRSALIFIGLGLMMALFLLGAFSVNAIILFGTALYVIATMLSRSDFKRWSNVAPNIYSLVIATFVFMRVLQPGLATEMWIPLALLFTLSALVFSALSLISLSGLNAFYWWSMGLLCHLFALQFSSSTPSGHTWIILSILFLLSICVFAGLLEMILGKLGASGRRGLRALSILAFMQLVGAFPGLCATLEMQYPLNYIVASHAVLVFILSLALVKMLFLPKSADSGFERGRQAMMGIGACSATLLLSQYFVLFGLGRSGDLSEDWTTLDPSKYLSLFLYLGLVGLGLLAAYFLAKNQKYYAFLSRRDQKRVDQSPSINPVFRQINTLIANTPQTSTDYASGRLAAFLDRISDATGIVEERFLQGGVWREGNAYLSSLSRYVRYFHRGSIRFYMFAAIVFFLIWSVFLVFI
jgi:hypothetical protein